MEGVKVSKRIFSLFLCITLLLSCHSNNKVVSTYGKRRYTKGWFLFKHRSVETKAVSTKDSGLRHTHPVITTTKKADTTVAREKEQSGIEKHNKHKKKEKIPVITNTATTEIGPTKKNEKTKTKEPPDPPDDFMTRLLVMIVVITALTILITGLITPIAIWGITQNFLLLIGVGLTFLAFFMSVNRTLGINLPTMATDKKYNIGKPAFRLSEWATGLIAFLYAVVKSGLISNALAIDMATIGMFFAVTLILLSLLLATKALFVNDRHPHKAIIALVIDAILITAIVLLFI